MKRPSMYGYHGCCYVVDVGAGRLAVRPLVAAGLDSFDPRSVLIFAFSPLVGTPLTTSAKFAVVGKSPLTGRFCDSLSSSHFALAGKRTGADAICITGQAAEWSIVVLDGDRLNLLPAATFVGQPAREVETALRADLGNDFEIVAIGPAAERFVPYAGISHDGRHAGRGGLGAILGGKRIKAIAVRGDRRTDVADVAAVVRLSRDLSARSFGPATEKYRELGTVGNLLTFNRLAVLPTRGFQASHFDGADAIAGEALADLAGKTRKSCASCTIGCEHIFPSSAGGVRMEYETLFALGSLCGIDDRDAVLRGAALCDRVGIDTISFGVTFAFACECVERGWLPMPADLDLRFGNADAMLQAIELVGQRVGAGELLALGSRQLAARLGGDAVALAPHVKGLEIPGYDPARLPMAALGFAVNPRGADHNRSSGYEVDFSGATDRERPVLADVAAVVAAENRAALLDSLILCKFVRGVFGDFYAEAAELLAAVTGRPWTAASLQAAAGRIVGLKRQFNIREGWTRQEDVLPARFLRGHGPANIRTDAVLDATQLAAFIDEYYRLRDAEASGADRRLTAR